jgi:type IV pilus assembly protein PilA
MTFYVADGDQQRGPFAVNELRAQGVGPDTLVWREGMAAWEPAHAVAELRGLFAPTPGVLERPVTAPYAPLPGPLTPPYAASAADLQYQSANPGFGPGYAAPPSAGLAIASMVVGILSLPLSLVSFCLWWISGPVAIIAVILGHAAKAQIRSGRAGGAGMATAGLVCGYIALGITAIALVTWARIFLHNLK